MPFYNSEQITESSNTLVKETQHPIGYPQTFATVTLYTYSVRIQKSLSCSVVYQLLVNDFTLLRKTEENWYLCIRIVI